MIFGKHINKYYLKYGWLLGLGLLALVIVDYVQLLIPGMYQMVINGLNNGSVIKDGVERTFDLRFLLDDICRPMLFIVLIMAIGRFLWRVCILGATLRMEASMREDMFNNLRTLSQQYFQLNKVGDLMSLFTNDLETVQECYGWGILMLVDGVFLGGLALIKMFRMNPVMTLICLVPIGILVTISAIVGKTETDKWEARQEAYSKLSDFAQESFSGISVIKAFTKELKELGAFEKVNKENEEANMDFVRTATKLRVMVFAFIESVTCVILGYGGFLVYKKVFNAGQLMEFIGYFNSAIWPAMALSELIDMTARGTASLKRVGDLLDAKPVVKDRDNVRDPGEIKGNIEFKNLTFRYPGTDIDVLKNVSFTIEAGENVGLVGKTGSGKTTIVDLILRTYNVPNGTLLIDGKDVNSMPIRALRDACAYVPQDNFLFSTKISENINFSSKDVSFEDIKYAAELADVDGNISEFPLGYDTILGERGVTVSGGQKQRISIARALMKNAPILILDDSVSAVDTSTERTILGNLRKTRSGKTTILIAHRISTIEQMDKVVFIEDGEVTAVGSHTQLYENCPEYHKMVDLQKLEEEGVKYNA